MPRTPGGDRTMPRTHRRQPNDATHPQKATNRCKSTTGGGSGGRSPSGWGLGAAPPEIKRSEAGPRILRTHLAPRVAPTGFEPALPP
jgi:hypothetical protein